ncbi:hypothetical protein SYNPS1DRAFT_30676 [Syncephalis pseudoplumigaleata]|uniref:Uncharacterized protein n=1 Tax=Syncephalis pseudoplumigaleata TaxID=1712513 RepID=A0A4P9YWB4_9FUNG|nr:hypothetical protein SYNPS1DRAFT_30676 [Syncephalis pseudoplumigaleata]|eukprot:RKP23571.1 hypothetical protein SYNPS1DRAFT_30676 [Syncephalis pseudoplumigaleata]
MAPSPGTPFDPNMPPPPPPPPPMPPTSGHFAPYSYPYPMPYGYPGPMPLAISPASPMECGWISEPHPEATPGPAKSKLKASAPEFVPGRLLQAKQQKQHGSTEHAAAGATASTPLQTPPLSASTSDYIFGLFLASIAGVDGAHAVYVRCGSSDSHFASTRRTEPFPMMMMAIGLTPVISTSIYPLLSRSLALASSHIHA